MSAMTPDELRAAFRPHDWDEGSKYAVAWLRDHVGIPAADKWQDDIIRLHTAEAKALTLEFRLEAAERWLVHAEHLPGCMEPGFVEDDCACGLRELRAAADAWELKEAALVAAIRENTYLYKRLEEAEKTLKKYGGCKHNCTSRDGWKCNCGFEKAVAALAGEEPIETASDFPLKDMRLTREEK